MPRTRKSLFTPVLLIACGAALLVWNLVPSFSFGRVFAAGWPWILVAWGVFRLGETVFAQATATPLPERLRAGHAVLAILLCVAGAAAHSYHYDSWFDINWDGDFDESFEFPVNLSHAAASGALISLDGLNGDIEVSAAPGGEVRVSGSQRVRAASREAAEARHAETTLQLSGEDSALRLSYARGRQARPRLTLRIELPATARLDVRDLGGSLSVAQLGGAVAIHGRRATLDLRELGGDVTVDLERSDNISATAIVGAFTLKGSAEDLSLIDIGGPVRVSGNVFGEIVLNDLRSAVEVSSKNSELQCEALAGMAELTGSRFEVNGFTGPAIVRSRGSKRILISSVDGAIEVTGQRSDVEFDARQGLTGDVRIHVERGDVDAEFAPAAAFQLDGRVTKGEVFNDLGSGLRSSAEDGGARATFGAAGPKVRIEIDRGDLRLTRAEPPNPSI